MSKIEQEEVDRVKKAEVDHVKKYDTVVNSGQSALRALLTINGGATIAFLTFIAHLLDNKTLSAGSVPLFVPSLRLFIYATFVTVLAYGLIFLTNCISSEGWNKSSYGMFGVTVICGLVSLVLFLRASKSAVDAFELFSKVLKP